MLSLSLFIYLFYLFIYLPYLGFDETMNVSGKPGNSDYHLSDPPAKALLKLMLRCY